jgi:hypothetical protein
MCLICVEFAKGKLTTKEARRAYAEMSVSLDREHADKVRKMLDEKDKEAAKIP